MSNTSQVNFKPHYNRALGKMIHTKDDYKAEMKRQGMVPQKEADQMAKDFKERTYKSYDKPSDEALSLMRGIGMKHPDRGGKIRLSDREIDQMKKIGVRFEASFDPRKEQNALR